MNNEIETIDGVKGEWRTVTKASDVKVGQRVRYECEFFRCGYARNAIVCNRDGKKGTIAGTSNLFNGIWKHIQAFFPLPASKEKRKVAKVRVIQLDGCSSHYFVTYPMGVYCGKTYATKKQAIIGAQRFCRAIGYECEIQGAEK